MLGREETAPREWTLCPTEGTYAESRREAEPGGGNPVLREGEDVPGDGDFVPCRRDHVLGRGETAPRGGGPSAPQR